MKNLITIGFDSDGEANFSVNGSILELSFEEMNELRTMIVVAIGTAEGMWRRGNEKRHQAGSSVK